LKHHPLKAGNDAAAAAQFRTVAEAYDVLSDPQRRSIFDQYGERGLKLGGNNGRGGLILPYTFQSNPEELFAEQFGTTSPFADFFSTPLPSNGHPSGKSDTLFKNYTVQEQKKVPAQEIPLWVTLEELYKGATKNEKVVRKRLQSDNRTLCLEEKIFRLDIGAGWKEGTKITFPKEGDEFPGPEFIPGDVVFVLKTKPHTRFTRKGADLIYRARLTLNQALTGTTITIETLDRRSIPIGINEVATPTSQKVVAGEGLPIPKNPTAPVAAAAGDAAPPAIKKGNLLIEFDIVFPEQLSTDQKTQINKILS